MNLSLLTYYKKRNEQCLMWKGSQEALSSVAAVFHLSITDTCETLWERDERIRTPAHQVKVTASTLEHGEMMSELMRGRRLRRHLTGTIPTEPLPVNTETWTTAKQPDPVRRAAQNHQ